MERLDCYLDFEVGYLECYLTLKCFIHEGKFPLSLLPDYFIDDDRKLPRSSLLLLLIRGRFDVLEMELIIRR